MAGETKGSAPLQGTEAARIAWWRIITPIAVAIIIALIPAPAGLGQHAWYYFALFSGFASNTVWLVGGAVMLALGYQKTGLGRRIALLLVRALGKSSLSLGYAAAFADTILAPFNATRLTQRSDD